ncbi:MAG: hypothetical protein G01um101417_126 [Parcubacteria group bacterium Gr01-1014_17]|nr:MAG: hypothetical protein G01um101417_126 [Parcubacteria group bacterium Gr01-1014_17]
MEIRFAASFGRDYWELSPEIRKVLDKKFALLLSNARHPSLRMKKMEGYENVWEARITKGYRFTFRKEKDTYLIRRAGPHDILKRP